jgi:hypothetical protein
MSAFLQLVDKGRNPFKVDYPYYGLFASAEVTAVLNQDQVFECRLRNGHTLRLQKVEKRWIDAGLNHETPLASIIGTSIDDFLRG